MRRSVLIWPLFVVTFMPLFAGSGGKFYIMSGGKMQGEAASVAKQMEALTEQAVMSQFPCASSMTTADAAAMLASAKDQYLLTGDPSTDTLKKIASALGADYVVNYTAVQVGNQMQISGSVITSGGQVISKNVITVSRNAGLTQAMKGLAQSLVGSMGSSGPKCGSGQWAGTVSMIENTKTHGNLTVNCNVQGSVGNCTVSFSLVASTKNGSLTQTASGSVQVPVDADSAPGRSRVKVGMIRIAGMATGTIEGHSISGKMMYDFGPWEGVSSSGDGKSSSGSQSPAEGYSVTWSLTKQ